MLLVQQISTTLYVLFSMCAFCVLLGGCNRHHGEVSFQTDGVTQTVRQGQIALRTDFPLPIYPKAQPSGSVSATDTLDHEDDRYLMLFSDDALDQIENFYRDSLTKEGWKLKNTQQFPGMVNMTAQKNDLEAGVMLTRNANKTTINLSVSRVDTSTKTLSAPVATTVQHSAANKLNLPDD